MEMSETYSERQSFWATRPGIALQVIAWLILAAVILIAVIPGASSLVLLLAGYGIALMVITALIVTNFQKLVQFEKKHKHRKDK